MAKTAFATPSTETKPGINFNVGGSVGLAHGRYDLLSTEAVLQPLKKSECGFAWF